MSSSFSIKNIALYLLLGIIFFNVNGLAFQMYDIESIASKWILLLCLVLVFFALAERHTGFSRTELVFISFTSLYVAQGSIIGYLQYGDLSFTVDQVRTTVSSALVTFAIARASFHYLAVIGPDKFHRVLWWILGGAALTVLIGKFYPEWQAITKSKEPIRQSGVFANPNEAGIVNCLWLSLTMARGMSLSGVSFLGAILGGLYCCYLTISRSAMLMSWGIVSFLFLTNSEKRFEVRNISRKVVLIGSVIASIMMILALGRSGDESDQVKARRLRLLADLVGGRMDYETTSSRSELLMGGYDLWLEHPLVGNGIGVMSEMPGLGSGCHNTFLKVAGELGVVGVAVFLMLISWWALEVLRLGKGSNRTFSIGVILVFLGYCMVSHNVLDDRFMNASIGISLGSIAYQQGLERRRNLRILSSRRGS